MGIWGGGMIGAFGQPRQESFEQNVGRATDQVTGPRGNAIRDYILALEGAAPRGPQSQSPGLALGAAQTLQGGLSPAEQEQQVAGQRQQINSLLGGLAGGNASDSLIASEGIGALTRSQGQIQSERDAATRGGAAQVFGGLNSALLGPDPLAEAFGDIYANSQRYGNRGGWSRI